MNPTRAAAAIHQTRAEHVGGPEVDPREHLNPVQREVWDSTARLISLLCGRRGGKTYFAMLWLLVGALEEPGSLSVYLALTKESARLIAWKVMQSVGIDVLGLAPTCFNDHTLMVHLPNGSTIVLKGTDDRRTIESWRGTKLYRAVVDEMGSQMPDLIQYFVQEILWPALGDLLGRLALLGTTGLVCHGYWWEKTRPEVLLADPTVFHWTIRENPHLPAEKIIADTLEEFGWTEETEAFKREWLAVWVTDLGAIVYPFDLERNGLDYLPEYTETGIIIPPSAWRYSTGHDVGVVDACSWVTWAWCPPWRGTIAVDSHTKQYDPDPAAVKTREVLAKWPGDMSLDSGGMGKAHSRIYRQKYAIAHIPAIKTEKPAAIRELRGDLLSGAAQVLNNPELDELRDQWNTLGWGPKKLHHNPNQPDHTADAALYGHRRVRHYTHKPDQDKQAPPHGTPERWMHDQRAMMEKRARKLQRTQGQRGGGRLDR